MRVAVLTNTFGAAASNGVAQTMAAIAARLGAAGHVVRVVVTAADPADRDGGPNVVWIGEDGARLGAALATGSRMPMLLARLSPQSWPVCLYLQDIFADTDAIRAAHPDRVASASDFRMTGTTATTSEPCAGDGIGVTERPRTWQDGRTRQPRRPSRDLHTPARAAGMGGSRLDPGPLRPQTGRRAQMGNPG